MLIKSLFLRILKWISSRTEFMIFYLNSTHSSCKSVDNFFYNHQYYSINAFNVAYLLTWINYVLLFHMMMSDWTKQNDWFEQLVLSTRRHYTLYLTLVSAGLVTRIQKLRLHFHTSLWLLSLSPGCNKSILSNKARFGVYGFRMWGRYLPVLGSKPSKFHGGMFSL